MGFKVMWGKSGKMFFSFFSLAALLPVLLVGVMSPDGFRLLTRADEVVPLRVWLEPEAVILKPGQKFSLKVMAEYDDPHKLIPKLELVIRSAGRVKVSPTQIKYSSPFTGRVEVGRVEVELGEAGSGEVGVVEGSVSTTLPDLPVVTSAAKITVK